MIDILTNNVLPCAINILTVVYILKKILGSNKKLINLKDFITIIFLIVLSIFNFIYIDSSVRILTSTLFIFICSIIIFHEPIHKTFTAVVLEQVILFVSELMYALVIIIFLKFDNFLLAEKAQGTFLTTIFICIMAIILSKIKIINKTCNRIMNYMDKIKQKNKYVLAFIFLITLNVLLSVIYVNSQNISMVVINVIFIIIYSYIIYLLLNEKNQNIIVKEENKNLLDNLHEYEKMLDYQRVANHENKNQLLVIKSMINKNNKKLQNYIDEVIKEKREDNETLYTKAKRIPSGGLQGLIYQKMLRMQDKNINIDLNISTEVRKVDFSKLNARTNYDICRSIGIIIDNAVDETLKVKDKEISISMYKDDNEFVIEIANKCKDLPDLDKIDNKGYTTKEKGHGYGLTLLKEICDANKDIINERKIVGNIFLQIIKIKM